MSGKSKFETRINTEIDKEEVLAAANKIKAYCDAIQCIGCLFTKPFSCVCGLESPPIDWDFLNNKNNQGGGE